jgi:tetratricopeptide (TPR) repeat protein
MKDMAFHAFQEDERMFLAPAVQMPLALPTVLGPATSNLLQRMFRDPRVLEQHERLDLIAHLRSAVELAPHIPEVRVLLGMALSVDLQAQEALEELRQATISAPDCFIAHLKFGELLMRLRVCEQAAEETQRAAQLASNAVQSELARRQAATIRTMLREGIERGGYRSILPRMLGFGRKSKQQSIAPVLVGSK